MMLMQSGSVAPSRQAMVLVEDTLTEMRSALEESTDFVTNAIHGESDSLDDGLYPATRESTRANIEQIVTMLARGMDPSRLQPPEAAVTYARTFVHEGLSLEFLGRAYRLGQRAYTKLWLQELQARADDAGELAEAMGFFSDWLFGYIEGIQAPLSEVYTAEHERRVRGGMAMRTEEVRSILAGAHVDLTASSSRLRYRLDGAHTGFVVWSEEATADHLTADGHTVFGDMETLAAEVLEALQGSTALLLPLGRIYAGWVPVGAVPEGVELPRGRNGLRLAIGRPGRGLEGFRRTHQEALSAKRVASLAQRATTTCVSFSAVALDALMTQDVDEARRFVAHELGPLLEDTDANRRVAATLEVFLQEESSFVRAARRLGVHENTVAYRVRRAETLLGRRVCERQLELRSALRLARFVQGE